MKNPKIQAFLAHAGVASRRKAEELVAAGQVLINGQVAQIGQRVEPTDQVTIDSKQITLSQPTRTFLIYKPVGVVSTASDELGRQDVVQFLQAQLGKANQLPRVYPVGRLDKDSEGLMILTNDGTLTHQFTHPSFEVPKTYQITVEGQPTEKALNHLERGVMLREGMTSPAQAEVLETNPDETTLQITIHEGRHHQVRRMLLRVGYEVTRLIRIKLGPFQLSDLQDKKFREVTHQLDTFLKPE